MLTAKESSFLRIAGSDTFLDTLDALARNILDSMDTTRSDRLWPADATVFQTNALNVANGACGISLFLYDTLGKLPELIREWLLAQPVDVKTYPPGLYSGIAGVAWSFAEMGMLEKGVEYQKLIPMSTLTFRSANIFTGAAGWGLAALALFLRTGDQELLDLACRAGDHLLRTAERDEKGAFWRSEDGVIFLGFGMGGSGIALFLLYLWRSTREARYLDMARWAMEFEIAHAKTRNGALVWGATVSDQGHRPYWLRGGGGVAATLIRFFKVLGEERYLELAQKTAMGCAAFFSVSPHLFEGLAAMGESLLDMYLATGDPAYLELATQKAEQTLLFRIQRPHGIAFPGRYLLRISHDYGVGGAGVGIFLHRLVTLGPRRFHDL